MTDIPYDSWEPVIGLEIHTQLNTKSKLFSPAPNCFGDEPNTNISYACTGLPGSLPVLNKEAVRKAIQFGLAVQADIARQSRFDRKSYFYPDTPRNFQITQFDYPIIRNGKVTIEVEGKSKTISIREAHLEDDAGMLKHFSHFAGIDYNRAGAPLIEIVSQPCMHSAKEAVAYAQSIRAIMLYLGASDVNMDEGNLRMDVNVSVRRKDESTLRPRIEIKNMNSFYFLELAIEAEIKRQIQLYTQNPSTPFLDLIPPGTYRWDPETKSTKLMRKKESSDDYRYFPEPDLPPLIITQEEIDEIAASLPELPHDRFKRYLSDLALTEYQATTLIQDKKLCDFFEAAIQHHPSPKNLCNWITIEFVGRMKEIGTSLTSSAIQPAHIAKLVSLIEHNKISGKIAKSIADDMVANPGLDPEVIIQKNPDYQQLENTSEIEAIVDKVLAENEQSILDFKAGKDRAFGFLVGTVMKHTRGKASPQIVNDLLRKKIGI